MTKPLTQRPSFGAAAILAAAAACAPLTASAAAPLKPGVYTETVSGHAGFIKVEVKLSADRIESVKILESNETPYIVDEPVAKVVKEVLERQTLAVDTVSGATRTTGAVLRAVGEAIEQAGGLASEWTPERVVVDPASLPLKDAPAADVLVVGAGASGLAAAAAAAESGARVIVLEKAPKAGGTAALGNGRLTAAGTTLQRDSGIPADPEGLVKVWLDDQKRSVRGGSAQYPDARRVEDLVDQSAATVEWLTKNVGLKFAADAAAVDGIGAYALEPRGVEKSAPAGEAQTAKLLVYAEKSGAKVFTGTPVWKLLTDESGRVAGAAASDGVNRFEFRAKAVVLATGGFASDLMKVTERAPRWAAFTDLGAAPKTITGDGLDLARGAGGVEVADSWPVGAGITPAYAPMIPAMLGPKGWAGITLVNERGERFVKEDLPVIGDALSEQRDAWLLLDSTDYEKANVLMAYFGYDTAVNGNTWEELGRRMGVPAKNLAKTMARYNADAAVGRDTVMGKAPGNLAPLTKAPFYAVRVKPVIGGTLGGVKTDGEWRVLNAAGKPVPGLWAVGEMANRAFYNRVYEPGTGLLIAWTSGRAAGAAAAKAALGR